MMDLTVEYTLDGVTRRIVEGDDALEVRYTECDGRHTVHLVAHRPVVLNSVTLEREWKYEKRDTIFVNGYQSWTDTKAMYPSEKLLNVSRVPKCLLKKHGFDRYGDERYVDYVKDNLHGIDVSYITGKERLSVISLNCENAYLVISHRPKENKMICSADVKGLHISGEFTALDFYAVDEDIHTLAEKCIGKSGSAKLLGYSSWYNHYQNVNEEKILYSLENLDKRFELFQIDDGYESFIGDWLIVDDKKFPNGLEDILAKIHAKGVKAGIWLAPFVAETNSRIYKEHKDWFLKDENGEPYFCGSNWSGFYALDIYNPETREYITKCLKHYADMGFDFFKLDFLYAVCLATPKDKTRSAVTCDGYRLIREALGDKLVLGCGSTMLPAAGVFDYMRIGPDVSLSFDDVWYMKYLHRERVSTKLTVQNTIYRSFLDGTAFGNDPDVFLLRDGVKMNDEQKRSLTIINALFGTLLMTSDDICSYNDKQNAVLNEALRLRDNAVVKGYKRDGNVIEIYLLDGGKDVTMRYNTSTGVLV